MPTLLGRTLLFFSSYAPLLVILAIRNWDTRSIALGLLALSVISVGALLMFLRYARKLAPATIEIERATSRDGDIVSYVVSYLLPFLAIDFNRTADLLSLSVLFVVIALLYVHSNLIYVNPLLAGLGYHLLEVEEAGGKVTILLTRARYVRPGARVRVTFSGDLLYLDVGGE